MTPVLLACRDLVAGDLSIYSGQRPDADLGSTGECDYILSLIPPVPRVCAPLVTASEAKRGDIELGLGRCVAQMVGARLFDERAGRPMGPIFGAVMMGGSASGSRPG